MSWLLDSDKEERKVRTQDITKKKKTFPAKLVFRLQQNIIFL